jgi:hypothetical protein
MTLMASIARLVDGSQPGATELRRVAIQLLTQWYVWRNDPSAEEAVLEIVAALPSTKAEASNMTFPLRRAMKAKPEKQFDESEAKAVRTRSVRIFCLILDRTVELLCPLLKRLEEKQPLSEDEGNLFREMIALASNLSRELYFAVGAFQENRVYGAPEIESPEQVWLYHAIGDGWDKLSLIGEAQIAHSLTQSLEMFIPIDPEVIFLRIGAILRASKAWGYQYEQLAFQVILRTFRTYLAEYPEIFQTNPDCLRIMRETLELFFNVGWPEARSLSYRLDDLFR